MTDRLTALKELLAKVEAGDESWVHLPRIPELHTDLVWKAWAGSLDAAKALHEVVLPEWGYLISCQQWVDVWWFDVAGTGSPIRGISPTPARAWLIAILRALIAQEEAPNG